MAKVRVSVTDEKFRPLSNVEVEALDTDTKDVITVAETGPDGIAEFFGLEPGEDYLFRPRVEEQRKAIVQRLIGDLIKNTRVLVDRGFVQLPDEATMTTHSGSPDPGTHIPTADSSGVELVLEGIQVAGGTLVIEFAAEIQHSFGSGGGDDPYIETHVRAFVNNYAGLSDGLPDYNIAVALGTIGNYSGELFHEHAATWKWYFPTVTGAYDLRESPVRIGIDVYGFDTSDVDSVVVEGGAVLQVYELVELGKLL